MDMGAAKLAHLWVASSNSIIVVVERHHVHVFAVHTVHCSGAAEVYFQNNVSVSTGSSFTIAGTGTASMGFGGFVSPVCSILQIMRCWKGIHGFRVGWLLTCGTCSARGMRLGQAPLYSHPR